MKQVLYSFALFGALAIAAPAAIGQTNKTATTTRSLVKTVNTSSSAAAAELLEKQQSAFAPGQRTPVANLSGERGTVANDDCAGAIMLTVGTACVGTVGTVDGATESQPSDTCSGFTSSLVTDVWYSFTANSASTTVQVTGDTLAAITDGYDAVLAIYEGSCGALTLINCVDATVRGGTETLTIPTVSGTTYYYRTYFYNYTAAQTVFGFSTCVFDTPPPPVNDQCSSVTPTDLTVGSSVAFSGTTAWATADGDYAQSDLITDPAVWHAFTTTECSEVRIDYCGSVPLLSDYYVILATTCPLDTGAIVFNTLNNNTDCADGNVTLIFDELPAGTYYIPVLYTGEAYEMNVSASPCGGYCLAGSDACDEFVAQFTFQEVDNITDCTGGYSDHTDMVATVMQGQSLAVTVLNGPPAYDGDQCTIWVDWNQDESFLDANEVYTLTTVDPFTTFTGTIDVPLDASVGSTRLRVRIMYTGTPDPCGSAEYGEVEDYTVDVMLFNGIEELAASDIRLFPNPGTGIFTLRALNTSGLSTIEVFDVTGRTVYNEQSQLNKGADHVMDLTGLTAGNYNVRVTANGVRTTQRLVIK
ncbi:MAG TPA: GEVED domain-containing protein [Flavobacteriales bacterium]|nr:GEVED domain-containing protein [Flavobacteriales bacterium]HQW40787.1 GEVED domain-containing protein [Flavobacteriales bacterium]